MNLKLTIATILLCITSAAQSADYKAGSIEVKGVWSRETPPTAQVGGGFMTLSNSGKSDDALVAIKAGVSGKVELHTHTMEEGVMKMREVPKIVVPAGGKTELKPGSFHVMFIDMKAPFKAGDTFPATLVFEKAGELKVDFTIRPYGYKPPGASQADHKH
jgi:periplasmic copper chaperone A